METVVEPLAGMVPLPTGRIQILPAGLGSTELLKPKLNAWLPGVERVTV